MRLARYGEPDTERPAITLPNSDHFAVDIADLTADIDGPFLQNGGLIKAVTALTDSSRARIDLREHRLGAPIATASDPGPTTSRSHPSPILKISGCSTSNGGQSRGGRHPSTVGGYAHDYWELPRSPSA
jgi:hypothetical protein